MAISGRNIVVNYIEYKHNNRIVENYAQTFIYELRLLDNLVTKYSPELDLKNFDLLIDLDCGRNEKGELNFLLTNNKAECPSAVWFIDSHGHPSFHHRIAPNYNHVFFAVWNKRDIFSSHKSAHWCPNATDARWFNSSYKAPVPAYDVGFFGSKMGLYRADALKAACELLDLKYDVRQISSVNKQRWPFTAMAMGNCKALFNHGQKHDGPNLRVLESMAMGLPLICDQDSQSGLDKLFTPFEHYFPYETLTYNGLEHILKVVMSNYKEALIVADRAEQEVNNKHLIHHRVKQILEVSLGNS